jgi:mannose-6-phosphate isomerase
VKPVPARFEPQFVERLWGVRSLAPLFADQPERAEPIGEVWLTGDDCRLATGPWSGRTVAEAWPEMSAEWRGTRLVQERRFPLLVKFLFPEQTLSIQVHPDDDYAAQHEAAQGGRGKTEMWYTIAARPGAGVMVGLKPGVTAEQFRGAIAGDGLEELLEHIPLAVGDAVFVPAGTVHTIGPGLVLCEIQENSDLTYRVYDYNRLTSAGVPRELHVEQAMRVIRFGRRREGKANPVELPGGPARRTCFVACRHFATERWEFREPVRSATAPENFELIIFLEGSGVLETAGVAQEYRRAEVLLLPATLGEYLLIPREPTTLLRTWVPDLKQEFASPPAGSGISPAWWSRVVFP